jgi:hypothetical protein
MVLVDRYQEAGRTGPSPRSLAPDRESRRASSIASSMGRLPDDSVEPLGAERGVITEVEVDVTLERAIEVERGLAATAHVVALVGAVPENSARSRPPRQTSRFTHPPSRPHGRKGFSN